jgi:hypothetical protein
MAANSSTKKIRIYAFDQEELEQVRPLLRRLLKSMGATGVRFSPVALRPRGPGLWLEGTEEYTLSVSVSGLGAGSRFSSSARREIRDFLDMNVSSLAYPASFINEAPRGGASGSGETALERYIGAGSKTPDSTRTRKAKAKSKARKQTVRRPNPKKLRYPSRGEAEHAIRGHGFFFFQFDKQGVTPLYGPTLGYDVWDDPDMLGAPKYRINVSHRKGTDTLDVRVFNRS